MQDFTRKYHEHSIYAISAVVRVLAVSIDQRRKNIQFPGDKKNENVILYGRERKRGVGRTIKSKL